MNRVTLLSACAIPALTLGGMTPAETAKGRFMRAPDDIPPPQGGGGESGPTTNNPTGNGGEGGNVTPPADNAGDPADLSTFWGNESGDGTGSGESLTPEQQREQETALGTELKGAIEGFAPAAPVFTKETAEQIAEGNFEGINKILADSHKQAIQQSILLSSKLMGAVVKRMQADFDSRINSGFQQKDDTQFLQAEFPLAKDPAFAPMVNRVWKQAMTNAKGDRKKATQLTRGMLEAFGSQTAPNLGDAAPDPTAGINTAASRSLVESLLER